MLDISETKIMENWKHHDLPLASVVYMTYNQERYIEDAMDSFLKQETSFPFEIVVHDDASTDRTIELIESYAKKYPNIIRTIFQKKNQFSQPKKNALLAAVSYTKGKYLAFCEGDDYWINNKKLEIQISEMQKNPKCEMSFHPALAQYENGKKQEKIISKHCSDNYIFTSNEVILGGGGFCPTASLIIDRSVFERIPEWFWDVPVGDYFLQILASLSGGALYLKDVMSVYRIGSMGSWSVRMENDENYAYSYLIRILKSIEDINNYTNKKYQNEFDIIKKKVCFFMCRNPVLSIEKRKQIFIANKQIFGYKRKILWYLLFRGKRVCNMMHQLRNYIFQ